MKFVLFLLCAFSFGCMVYSKAYKSHNVEFSDVDLKIIPKLSLPSRAVLMKNNKEKATGQMPQRIEGRKVGISAQVAHPFSLESEIHHYDSAYKPGAKHADPRDQVQDELAALTKILQLMLETASASANKKAQSDEIAKLHSNQELFNIGSLIAKCDSTLNVMKEASSMIQILSEQMSPLDHVDAYERIIILSEQFDKECKHFLTNKPGMSSKRRQRNNKLKQKQ